LVIAPNGVAQNWCLKEIPTHLPFYHENYSVFCYESKKAKSQRHKKALKALLSYPKLAILLFTYDGFMTIAGTAFGKKFLDQRRCLYVLDECFPAGTLVDTPQGPRPIEDIKVGDEVLNCAGVATVKGTYSREIKQAVTLTFDNRSITTSPSHPFFTERGWVPACHLQIGEECVSTEEAMRMVQNQTTEETKEVLQPLLLGKMENVPAGDQSFSTTQEQTGRTGESKKEASKDMRMVWGESREQEVSVLREILLSEMEDESARDTCQGIHRRENGEGKETAAWEETSIQVPAPTNSSSQTENIRSEKGKAFSCRAGRERKGITCSAKNLTAASGARLGSGVCGEDWEEKTGSSNLLQDRYSPPQGQDSSGTGRTRTPLLCGEREGLEKRQVPARSRLESIKVLELERDGGPGETFYDLEIEPHPSYSVEGLLVHNSHRVKTPGAKRTQRIVATGKRAPYRRILTGTPTTVNPWDVYTQIRFLDPTFWRRHGFGSLQSFKTYFGIWEDGWNPQANKKFPKFVGGRNLEELGEILSEISSRVTKEEVLDLPLRTFTQRFVEMTPTQRKMYNQFKNQFFTELDEHPGEMISAPFAMTRLIRFQQILLGFLMDDGEVVYEFDKNPRLDMLCDTLENDIDGQVIIWANYTRAIDHLMERLGKKAVRYDGQVKDDKRHAAVNRFQGGGAQYFIGNQAAGGIGLTLTAAPTMVYYSNSNRPEDRWQSLDRNHRIGQTKNTTVIDLIGGPIDQSTLDRLAENTEMAKTITRDKLKEMV
jgi:hypothetical protein